MKRREGQEIDGQHDTLDDHGWTSSPSQTYMLSYSVYNYLVSGEDEESRFVVYTSDTCRLKDTRGRRRLQDKGGYSS